MPDQNFSMRWGVAAGATDKGTPAGTPISDNPDSGVNALYSVSINSKKSGIVNAAMQDDLSFRVDSIWESAIPELTASGIGRLVDALVQFGAGGDKSLANKYTSRRFWHGTRPLEIILPLRFEALNDAMLEVVVPCQRLQAMALPSDTGVLGFLAPPGPSPYTLDPGESSGTPLGAAMQWAARNQDIISVHVGKIAWFPLVIMKSVQVTFAPRLTPEGIPIGARADVTFETFQIVTKEALDKIYYGTAEAVAS